MINMSLKFVENHGYVNPNELLGQIEAGFKEQPQYTVIAVAKNGNEAFIVPNTKKHFLANGIRVFTVRGNDNILFERTPETEEEQEEE